MILRPVRPQSPIGPPTSNLPVGLTRKLLSLFSFFSSYSSAGRIGCSTCFQRSGLISVSESTPGLCWVEIEKVLISTQHKPGVDSDTLIKPDLWEHVLHPILPAALYDEKQLNTERNSLVNPTGTFE